MEPSVRRCRLFVDHRAVVSKHRSDLADERDLFVAQKATTLDKHDTGMDLPRGGELDEVVDVRGYEHAIFLVGTFENVVIARPENPAISNMACIDAIGRQPPAASAA